jgi:hypothetical protein
MCCTHKSCSQALPASESGVRESHGPRVPRRSAEPQCVLCCMYQAVGRTRPQSHRWKLRLRTATAERLASRHLSGCKLHRLNFKDCCTWKAGELWQTIGATFGSHVACLHETLAERGGRDNKVCCQGGIGGDKKSRVSPQRSGGARGCNTRDQNKLLRESVQLHSVWITKGSILACRGVADEIGCRKT